MDFIKFIDSFIPIARRQEAGELRQTRLFVKASLLTGLFSTTYIWLSIYFEYEKGIYLMLFNAIGFIILAYLTKTKIPIKFLGNCYVLVGAIAVISLSYYSGGIWSAIYPWICAIPTLAMLVVDRKSGLIWALISLIVMVWFGVLAVRGIALPMEYNIEMKALWFLTVLPGLLLIIVLVTTVFEMTKTNALKQLERSHEELKFQKATIVEKTEKLQEMVEEKEYMIRVIAHDIRGPLKNIEYLNNLLDNSDESEQAQLKNMMEQALVSAQDLVERVLMMDKTEHQNNHVKLGTIDVVKVAEKAIEILQPTALEKNISLLFENKTGNELITDSDKSYLSLIFENLLSNSIKFSDRNTTVTLQLTIEGRDIKFTVADQGPGISPDEVKLLFKKFSKLSNRPTGNESSTGLGLALAKRYADLLGAQIAYEPNQPRGACFALKLPRTQ